MNEKGTASASDPLAVDSIDNHMAAAGSIDRAALLPGMYLGWCVRLGLVAPAFRAEHETAVLRLNYGEGSGVELLVSCGGSLHYDWLSAQGKAFTRHYYPNYAQDWVQVFGAQPYAVTDSWTNYDRLAPVLTKALYAFTGHSSTDSSTHSSRGGGSKRRLRWKFWQ